MRPYPPIYPGDSMFEPGLFPGLEAEGGRKTAFYRPNIVHSNIDRKNPVESGLPAAHIEHQARATRGSWAGSKLKPYYEMLVRKLALGGQAELERYLAASQCLADLEHRIRRYERMQSHKR